ncbi:hypothetical protein AALP_AA1G218100 [Arabis alpina]|uniref:HVA22-like protein n=1 Tax=Arabis alpina TaxID=50452 RepID=A0A087HPR8_ARAAL|nr:hypothetical protein AALP_AA1G218100 [Arabis alpina]
MGKLIVHTQSTEPGEREFLMDLKDICHVLVHNTGTKKVLGIALNIDETDELHIAEDAFKEMWLKNIDMWGSGKLKEIPDLSMATNLETLNLGFCSSLVELPSSIQYLNKLKELEMPMCKNLETLPTGINLKSLYRLNLNGCSRLMSFPDMSENIKELDLEGTRIEEFASNLRLQDLVDLNMSRMKSDQLWEIVQPLRPLMTMLSPSLKMILVAALTIFERVGDAFASWVPLYCEAKLAFFIYLWFPKTRGTTYVYDSFFKPYVAKHENEIDRNLIELRTKAGDMAVIYCRQAVSYGQTRFTEILHFVALQSTPKPPQPKDKKKPQPEEEEEPKQPDLKTSQAASSPQVRVQPKKPQLPPKEPVSPKTIPTPRKQQQQQQTESKEAKASVSQTKLTPLPPPPASPSTATKPNADSPQPLSSSTETEKASQIVTALPASVIQRASSSKETIMEETLRVTRGSLRKARSTGTR